MNFQSVRECDIRYRGGASLNILVSDVDAAYRQLKDAGAVICEDINDHDWGDRSFTVLDPLGTVLYIYSLREIKGEFADALKEPIEY